MSEFELEVNRLKFELEESRKRVAELEEECDLLAFDNDRLRDENARLSAMVPTTTGSDLSVSDSTSSAALDVFVEGDGQYANALSRKILEANGSKNVLCCAFMTFFDESGEAYDVLLSGGVDCSFCGYESATGFRLFSYKLSGPVLAIDVHKEWVACSLMDGGHAVLTHSDCNDVPYSSFKEHSKYVISIKFSSDGHYLATASHDKSVILYQRNDETDEFDKIKTIQFVNTPESLAFTQLSSAEGAHELIIGLREVCHLIYLNCASFEQRQVSLNVNDWDLHVSYTPLYLAVCPENKYLLIATDKNLHYIVKIGTNKRVRTLAGHSCGDYGKPVACWDPTGRYIYCNSEEDSAVYIYSLATERVVGKLQGGHRGLVRGLACHPHKRLVLTASYDKTIILWNHQNNANN